MTISQTTTVLSEDEAKRRIKDIVDNNQIIRTRVDAFVAQLDASPNLRVLQEIEQDATLTPEERDIKKAEKKRDLAIFAQYVTVEFFRTEVNQRL
jgi:hypothetical protein